MISAEKNFRPFMVPQCTFFRQKKKFELIFVSIWSICIEKGRKILLVFIAPNKVDRAKFKMKDTISIRK